MQYFIDVVTFFDEHLLLVAAAFVLATFVELIVYLAKIKNHKFDLDGFFIAVASNITAILGVYVLACLGVGLVNCVKDQDWHFWQHFIEFLNGDIAPIGVVIIGIAGAIFWFFKSKIESCLGRIIVSLILGALTAAAGVVAAFIIYVVGAFIIIVIKLVWFVVSGFFVSIFDFVKKYWQWALAVLIIPGLLFGLIKALIYYIASFKKELFD